MVAGNPAELSASDHPDRRADSASEEPPPGTAALAGMLREDRRRPQRPAHRSAEGTRRPSRCDDQDGPARTTSRRHPWLRIFGRQAMPSRQAAGTCAGLPRRCGPGWTRTRRRCEARMNRTRIASLPMPRRRLPSLRNPAILMEVRRGRTAARVRPRCRDGSGKVTAHVYGGVVRNGATFHEA